MEILKPGSITLDFLEFSIIEFAIDLAIVFNNSLDFPSISSSVSLYKSV